MADETYLRHIALASLAAPPKSREEELLLEALSLACERAGLDVDAFVEDIAREVDAGDAARVVVEGCGLLESCSLAEFLAATELHADEVEALRALSVGESYQGGGGAFADWSVRRIA